jgi:hypothetical protein
MELNFSGNKSGNLKIQIVDQLGRVVHNQTFDTSSLFIDTKRFVSGMYNVILWSDDAFVDIQKIVIR